MARFRKLQKQDFECRNVTLGLIKESDEMYLNISKVLRYFITKFPKLFIVCC